MPRYIILSILTLFVIAFDFYCYNAMLSVFKKWTPKTKKIFKISYWLYSILLIIGVFCSIYFKTVLFLSLKSIILVAFFLTVVCKFVMLPFLLIDDIRRLIILLVKLTKRKTVAGTKKPIGGEPISRSTFLVKTGLVVAAAPLSSLTWGIISGAYDYQIKRVNLILPNLPKAFDGIRMAQISDIHSGSFYNKTAVKGGVELLLAEKPDFVFFTGDLVNNLTNEVSEYQDIFAKIKAPLGVYSTLGNHDYGDYHFGRESSPSQSKKSSGYGQNTSNYGL
jgi:hypothetical protein